MPCVVWSPYKQEPQAAIAMCHGGSLHKKTAEIKNQAIQYAKKYHWTCFALDAPGHGDRVNRHESELQQLETLSAIKNGGYERPLTPLEKAQYVDNLSQQSVPEWKAVLDVLLSTGTVPSSSKIGYWGVSMGSWIGIPLLAADSRYSCAVIGLSQLHPVHNSFKVAAQSIRIPLRYVLQWDDELRDRKYGLELFDTFASKEKSMHVNMGGHLDVPDWEKESWGDFFHKYLGSY